MNSKRILWIGLVIGLLVLVGATCASCGGLMSSLFEYPEDIPADMYEEPEIQIEPDQAVDYANLPTPALKVDVPAFAEGELPVGAVVQIVVDGVVNGIS